MHGHHIVRWMARATTCLLAAVVPAFPVVAAPAGTPPETARASRPDVLLITVDTLRADHLGAYGYPRETTPNIDALAARGVRFADCTVQWPKTWPSIASFMTGTYPRTNGIRINRRVLPEAWPVIPEIFRDAGYRTGAVVTNWNIGPHLGFGQGFEQFKEAWQENALARSSGESAWRNKGAHVKLYSDAAAVTDHGLEWLEGVGKDDRWFLWLHYMDPHGPYIPPEPYASMFKPDHPGEKVSLGKIPAYQLHHTDAGDPIQDRQHYVSQYDGEVRFLDTEIGRLLGELKARGRDRDLLILFTADHGEALGEHNYYFEHGRLSYQPNARVPAILVGKGSIPEGAVVTRPVGLIDVSRTLVEAADLPVPRTFEGRSLLPLIAGEADAAPAHIFMESGYDAQLPQTTVRQGRWKLIHVPSEEYRKLMAGTLYELYDLVDDPEELTNLSESRPDVVAGLARVLSEWQARTAQVENPGEAIDIEALDEKTLELLRSLGYVDSEK